jgi:hypothetical protein
MVLGDFLKRRIAPLQQQTRMACMYTGTNDCCRIARGPGTNFSRVELETAFRAMTGEAFSLESLVLPSGIKALCEDQALRLTVLASMPTLDEGGLAVRQLRGDPNRGIHIPGASPDRQQRANQGPRGPSPGGPGPAGKGKDKVLVPEHRHKDNVEGSKTRRLQRGDGSFVGEPAPKRQKMAEAERQSSAPPPPPNVSSRRGGWRRRDGLLRSSRFLRRHSRRGAQRRHHHRQSQGHKPRPRHQKHQRLGTTTKSPGGSSAGKKIPPVARGVWEWYDFM